MTKFELLLRLEEFVVHILAVTEIESPSKMVLALKDQLVRSASSPALNYAESMGASSHRDFVNKLNICIKELRETLTNLSILYRLLADESKPMIQGAMDECNQLISILVKSVNTTRSRYGLN